MYFLAYNRVSIHSSVSVMDFKKIYFCCFLAAGFAHAEGAIRCGNSLVSVGDSKVELLMKCGQPLTVDTRTVFVEDNYHNRIAVQKEILTIDQGDDKFLGIVTIDSGKIINIEDGPRKE